MNTHFDIPPHAITCKQNQRRVGFEGTSGPIPLPRQSHLEQVTQERVQANPECLQRGRPHHPSGQPVPVLCILTVNKFFLMWRWNFCCFSLWPRLLVPSLGTTEKSLAPSPWHRPRRYLYALTRSPSARSSRSRQAQLPQPRWPRAGALRTSPAGTRSGSRCTSRWGGRCGTPAGEAPRYCPAGPRPALRPRPPPRQQPRPGPPRHRRRRRTLHSCWPCESSSNGYRWLHLVQA